MISRVCRAIVKANVALIAEGPIDDCQFELVFVEGQLHALPFPFRFPMIFLLLVFEFFCPWGIGPFHIRSLEKQIKAIRWCNQTSVPVIKDFAKFFHSLTVFAHYSRPEEIPHD